MRGAPMGWRNRGPSAAEAVSFPTAHGAPEGAPFQRASWFQNLEISERVSLCILADLHLSVRHPPDVAAAALLLGRGRLLRSRGARFAADRLVGAAHDAVQRTPAAGDDLAGLLVEV